MESRVKIKNFIIFIVLLTYLKPFNISLIPSLNKLYSLAKVVATVALFVYIAKRRIGLTNASKWCLAFVLWWTISIIRNGNIRANIQVLLSIIGMLFLFNIMQRKRDGIRILIRDLCYIAEIYIVLQLYTVIVDHPVAAETTISFDKYFLGSDNYSAFILIPLAGFIVLNSVMNYKKVSCQAWLFIGLGFLCLFIPRAWTGLFAYLVFILLIVLRKLPFLSKLLNMRNVFAVIVLALVAVMVFHVQDYLGAILGALGKVGMNSREIIWPKAIRAIKRRLILGYGVLTETQISSYILYGATHTHNIILEFLMDSGIIGTLFAFMWLKTSLILKKLYYGNNLILCLYYCIVAYFVCSIMDFYIALIYFWLMIFLFDSLKVMIEKESREKRQ